jgi:aryl-alcohol dehydrogenase (NADP+)
MEFRRLGQTGLKVSRLCLGMMTYGDPKWRPWVLPAGAARPFVIRALELGINFFDTADMYSLGASEQVTGQLLRELARRDEVVIATKVFNPMGPGPNERGLSRAHILNSIDASLKRLGLDYVDLYQIHRYDPDTPIEETLQTLHEVVQAGKARYIGASSMYAWQFARMLHVSQAHGWARFVSMQNHYNLVYREEEREMLPLCHAEGVGIIPWSPLARGFLAGNRTRTEDTATMRAQTDDFAQSMYYRENDFAVVDQLKLVAAARGATPAQVALAWVLAQPGVTAPIIGTSRIEQLNELGTALSIKLSEDECRTLQAVYQPHPVLGHS